MSDIKITDFGASIQEDFPLLKRAQIYGAIAFYLDHQAEIDKYLKDTKQEFEGSGIPMSEENPGLWARIQQARAQASQAKPGEPCSGAFVSKQTTISSTQ